MLPKTKIRLSRLLRAQTTPYPNAGRWVKRGVFITVFLLGVGIYLSARPQPRRENPPTKTSPKEILGEQEAATQYLIYTVKKGDTLFNLSQRYGISWQTLAELNNLEEPYLLKIGQKIKLPKN